MTRSEWGSIRVGSKSAPASSGIARFCSKLDQRITSVRGFYPSAQPGLDSLPFSPLSRLSFPSMREKSAVPLAKLICRGGLPFDLLGSAPGK
ncbi:hypothetical protein CRG98_004363 [Punica granatum]|uniref:Uncharacterized protein n=1 Tax=Punica granatum TaxID=22663 RepID=A0A2I0L3E3_PUNGR|nr:hypothetical protein CRG98_004363 [Punica granatum]